MRKWIVAVALAVAGCASGPVADVDLEIRPALCEHRERITESPHVFTVNVNADDIGVFSRYTIVDDIMQSVSIEGAATNPRLVVPGMPDLRSAEALLASILRPGMTDLEKAVAIHTLVGRFSVYTSSPRTIWGLHDPIIALNSAAGICGNFTVWNNALAREAGLTAHTYEISGHTVPEVFFDGRWHMFDPTTRTFFIGRDNREVAGVMELEHSPDIIRRVSRRSLAYYGSPQNDHVGASSGYSNWKMDLALRPGETFRRLTDKAGPSLWNYRINRNQLYSTGFLAWTPDLAKQTLEALDVEHENVLRDSMLSIRLRPRKPGVTAYATFKVRSPHPVTQATLTGRFGKAEKASTLRVIVTAYAPGMTTWPTEVFVAKGTGIVDRRIDLTPAVFGAFGYDVRFEMIGSKEYEPTGIEALAFESVLQLNRHSLPHLNGGENRITYVDDGKSRDVTIVYNWREKHPLTNRPWPAVAGRENVLVVTVRNRGTEAVENVPVLVEQRWVEKPITGSFVVPRIEPGATATVEMPWKPARGRTHCFRATVDPDGAIRETDEKNNVFERIFRVYDPPDVSIEPSQIVVEKSSGRATLEALLVNQGGLPARDVEVLFATGDGKEATPLGRVTVPVMHSMNYATESVDPFAWARLEVPMSDLKGPQVKVVVDPDGKLHDGRRSNNEAWVALADAGRKTPWEPEKADPLVGYSFEPPFGEIEDGEVEGLVEAVEVRKHATHEKQSAKFTFAKDGRSEFVIVADGRDVRLPRDWTDYREMRIDAYNESKTEGPLTISVLALLSDGKRVRSDATFALPARKEVTLALPFDRLKDAGLAAVDRIAFSGEGTVYLDALRLADKPEKSDRETVLPTDVKRTTRDFRSTKTPKPIALTSDDDIALFVGEPNVRIASGFGAPGIDRAARFDFRQGDSVGLTLDMTQPDSPWPTDWSRLKTLKFQAKGKGKMPLSIGLKLRSSDPVKGVKEANASLALREAGASYSLDLSQFARRIDLDRMTRITWFIWKSDTSGTIWLGDLKLE